MTAIYDFQETEMNGTAIDFSQYQGKVLLIVNTASKCGLAPQLKGLKPSTKSTTSRDLRFWVYPLTNFIRN